MASAINDKWLTVSPGNISQWGEVKKKTKERSQSKVKEAAPAAGETSNTSARGGRGRGGSDGPRGGRGRGSDRGRGTTRGGRAGSTANGTRHASGDKSAIDSAPPAVSPSWDEAPKTDGVVGNWDQAGEADTTPLESSWEHVAAAEATPAPAAEQPKPLKPDGTRSWASIFSKPAPAPVQQKAPQHTPVQEAEIEPPAMEEPTLVEEDMPGLPPPIPVDGVEALATPPASAMEISDPALEITPSKDLLTETNLEQLPDVSEPAPVATAASTAASTIDQRTVAGGSTPLHPSQQPATRPPMGGFATSAFKATSGAGRSASYNRRLAEQQEAVVMPGKQSVDRAAVQFGSMGLNGTAEDGDVDSDREEPETRAQPPQHSPIAPRASLPPASQAASILTQPPTAEPAPTPRQAPGLPPVGQQPTATSIPDQAGQQATQPGYPYNQYARYGSQPSQQETPAPAQKPYEPFGQQIQQHQQFDGYPSTSQPQSQGQTQQAPSQMGGYSSAPTDMSSYYTSDSQRNAYQSYYNNYTQQQPQQSQQSQQSQQESGSTQQRVGSAFGTSASEQAPQYATSHQAPSRYGQPAEAATSGQSTPNPALPNQQQPQSQPGHMHQQQGQAGGQHGGYPYGHPSYAYNSPYGYYNQHVSNHPHGRERPPFDDVRRYDDQYLTHTPQFGYGGNQGGYGGGPFGGAAGGKQGMYGQPHQGYGVNPQSAYDQHSSSPANVGGFGQHAPASRDGPTSGGLGSYGRTGSTQPTEGQQGYGAAGAYSAIPDVFGRSQSGYPSNQVQQGGQQGASGSNEDSLRAYDSASKGASGPSPALGQPGGRPGSAVSGMQQNAPPQGQGQGQQGYGGYPGHLQMHGQQANQYGATPGGLGGHHQTGAQTHQGSGYGAYGAGFGNYYGSNNRGGWSGNYGH